MSAHPDDPHPAAATSHSTTASRVDTAIDAIRDRVKLVALDVDGVLTDGRLHYGPGGEAHKSFHVHDGMGVRMMLDRGLVVAVITARRSEALARRCADLGITHIHQGRSDKREALGELCAAQGIDLASAVYVGDDRLDAPALAAAGLGVAPADARPEAQAAADWVTRARGGRGVVRELADALVGRAPGFRVIIPARYAATRLPGKPLRELAGKPLVQHVWHRAMESGASEVVVAVDDERIRAAVAGFGGRAVMTAETHLSGTDRLAEVIETESWPDDTIVVNVQGDEPGLPGELIRHTAHALAGDPGAGVATLATTITSPEDLFDGNVVKVVLDRAGRALAFSRAPIPWVRDAFGRPGGLPEILADYPPTLPEDIPFLRHIGIYAYRVGALRRITRAARSPLERAESLEQLRALHIGVAIRVEVVDGPVGHGVDTEDDLARAEAFLLALREHPPGASS